MPGKCSPASMGNGCVFPMPLIANSCPYDLGYIYSPPTFSLSIYTGTYIWQRTSATLRSNDTPDTQHIFPAAFDLARSVDAALRPLHPPHQKSDAKGPENRAQENGPCDD